MHGDCVDPNRAMSTLGEQAIANNHRLGLRGERSGLTIGDVAGLVCELDEVDQCRLLVAVGLCSSLLGPSQDARSTRGKRALTARMRGQASPRAR